MRMQINQPNIADWAFVYTCLRCRNQHTSSTGYCADLDGESFKAYYCLPCGSALKESIMTTYPTCLHPVPTIRQTCTPYDGRFTKAQQEDLLDFLWSALRPVPGVDQVYTGYDTKTKTGLLRVIERIVFPKVPTKKKGNAS